MFSSLLILVPFFLVIILSSLRNIILIFLLIMKMNVVLNLKIVLPMNCLLNMFLIPRKKIFLLNFALLLMILLLNLNILLNILNLTAMNIIALLTECNMKMFSVLDTKAEAYMLPTFYRTIGEAIRSFELACRDPQSPFHQFPSDFVFFEIGEFDELTSKINSLDIPHVICTASDFKKSLAPAKEA